MDSLIERYLDGALPEDRWRRVEVHLASCAQCRARLEEARSVAANLASGRTREDRSRTARTPDGFSARVMDRVYRDELDRHPSRRPVEGRLYRRLGLSFVTTAAVLSVSLFVPRIAYPNLIHEGLLAENLAKGRPASVERIIADAGGGMRSIIGNSTVASGRQ